MINLKEIDLKKIDIDYIFALTSKMNAYMNGKLKVESEAEAEAEAFLGIETEPNNLIEVEMDK